MPPQVPESELDAIVQVVRGFPAGASVSTVHEALPLGMGRRALQRRMATLVAQGRLIREGSARATRYRVPPVDRNDATDRLAAAPYGIPLSPEAAAVARAVAAPIQQRAPVGYNRSFLEDYRPGGTWYLADRHRQALLAFGDSPDRGQVAGTQARRIYERLLIDLSWNSSRLEGNTYSLLETARLLELGEAAEGKDALETQMILNHKAAIRVLVEQSEHMDFNAYTVCNLHAILAENLIPDSRAWGRLRSAAVDIGGSVYHPLENPHVIEECLREVLYMASAVEDPFEQAFFTLVHLPYLQPFLDVNKRVSRLAANLPFLRANLCPLSFIDVPRRAYIDGLLGVYELNRIELLRDVFLWAYERSSARYSALRQSVGEPDRFRQLHAQRIADAVHAVVAGRRDKQAASDYVRESALGLAEEERARYMEIVQTDLLNLHGGNIARVRISPEQFAAWMAIWRPRD